jgi:CMP-N,N'-diacetyllegionaminic acid synthase
MRKFLGVITARKGSKGLPGKNRKPLLGKPLIYWTVEAALGSSLDGIVCSTDDQDIKENLKEIVTVIDRPAALATDEASIVDVLLQVSENFPGYTDVVLLQPTSPFRKTSDIESALRIAKANSGSSVISVTKSRKSPYWSYRIDNEGNLNQIFDSTCDRRQALEQTYLPNGAIYIVPIESLKVERKLFTSKTLPIVMPPERSVDIDDEFDFRMAELLGKPEPEL